MRFGSVCSGIEAASVAWEPLGWKASWFSEIEPFPSAVLKYHHANVPNLGDMTALPARIRAGEVDAPDILCGGTPCQAFSVAGLRQSLDDERGNLSLIFCEIADAIDNVRSVRGDPPVIVFWENVPGVLSTKDNAFGCFLAGLAGEDDALIPPGGRWSNAGWVSGPKRAVAWRTLDAQYFGLAQRRKRVFVVASSRDRFDPAAILFESDSVRRDSAPSREAGKDTAGSTAPCLTSSGRGVDRTGDPRGQDPVVAFGGNNTAGPIDVATARNASASASGRMDFESETFLVQPIAHTLRGEGFDASEDGTGRGTPLVPNVAAFTQNSRSEGRQIGGDGQVVGALAANAGAQQQNYIAFHPTQDPISSTGVCHAIGTGSGRGCATAAVAQPIDPIRYEDHQQDTLHHESGIMSTLPSGTNNNAAHYTATVQPMQVRRLTPVECERLQGFPDDYTQIQWRNKPADECPDGPRYKALGNSWAIPPVRWIGLRIAMVDGIAAGIRRAA